MYIVHICVVCTPGVANLWPAGQMWPFLNPEEQKKGHQKNLKEMANKYELMTNTVWPSTKKVYNFFIFWPTYHKRLVTPGVHCTSIQYTCDCILVYVYLHTELTTETTVFLKASKCLYFLVYVHCTSIQVHYTSTQV